VDDEALTQMIHRYTKEAGVRALEREIATVCRKIAKEWLAGGRQPNPKFDVIPERLPEWLGVEKYREHGARRSTRSGWRTGSQSPCSVATC